MRFRPGAPSSLDPVHLQEASLQYGTVERYLASHAAAEVSTGEAAVNEDGYPTLENVLLQWVDAEVAPPVVSGLQLYTDLRDRQRLLPTGCDSLDMLLRGGLREGQHTELYGESASGKTQLCLLATLSTAVRGEGVVYLDTGGGFSAARLDAMYRAMAQASATQALPPLREALACVTVARPRDVHDAAELLDELAAGMQRREEEWCLQQQQGDRAVGVGVDIGVANGGAGRVGGEGIGGNGGGGGGGGGAGAGAGENGGGSGAATQKQQQQQQQQRRLFSLLIVDSLSALVSPVLGGSGAAQGRGHALMVCLARLLRRLAERHGLAVLSTNHQVGGGPRGGATGPRPAMGDSWRNQPHCRVHLAKEVGARCRATLKACPISPCEEQAWFQLTEAGPQPC